MQAGSAEAAAADDLRASELTVETLSTEKAFLEEETLWNRIVEQADIDHPFLTHGWVRTWWRCFGGGKELHIARVSEGRDTIAIAPLMLTHGRIYGIHVRKLEFMANVHTPRFDIIVARSPERVYAALWKHLLAHREQWDVIELRQLPSTSRSLKDLARLAATDAFPTGTWHSDDCPYVEFRGGWHSYFRSLSSNHRSQMRKRMKRLGRLGPIRLEAIDQQDQGALKDGLRIEAAAWKARAGTAILCRPDLTRFYTEMADETARQGILRLFFLNVGGTRIAFAYALCYRNKLYVLKAGYQPEYAPYSPYNVLCHLVFQDACERGLTEYEFLGNADPWKLHWTKTTKPHYWLYIFSRTLRTQLIHAAKFRFVPAVQRNAVFPLIRRAALVAGKIFVPDFQQE